MNQVTVSGLKELRKALVTTIPQEMQGKVLQSALAAGARPIVRDAKAKVPVREGNIKRAIYSGRNRKESTRTREVRVVGVRTGKKYGARDAFYWRFVEFGHRIANKATGRLTGKNRRAAASKGVGFVPAQPFMRPAFEAQKGKAVSLIRDRLKVAIEKAARKASWRSSFGGGRSSVR